jgi:hypothetical protein
MWWHTKQLIDLRNKLRRPIQLILRGGTRALTALSGAYPEIILIDSDPLLKALHRQRMIFGNDRRMKTVKSPLPRGVPVDDLLIENITAAKSEFAYLTQHPRIANSLSSFSRRISRRTSDTYDKTGQLDILADSRSRKYRADTVHGQRMVSSPKPKIAAEVQKTSK